MKLQSSFDMPNLENALDVAKQVSPYADILEVATILLLAHGIDAILKFKSLFPDKTILADSKIVDRSREIITMLNASDVEWVTVMAGTSKNVIHSACTTAHELGKKVMLDLLDASSVGQTALEAKNLGADALLFHQPYDEQDSLVFLDKWEMVKGNTDLPIFVSAKIKRETIHEVIKVRPDAVIIGKSITESENPSQEANYFKEIIDAA